MLELGFMYPIITPLHVIHNLILNCTENTNKIIGIHNFYLINLNQLKFFKKYIY